MNICIIIGYICYRSLYFDLHHKTFLDKLFICKEIFYKRISIDYIKNLREIAFKGNVSFHIKLTFLK